MKRKCLTLCIFLMANSVMTSFGQNPSRKIIFTLRENESIVSNEYYLIQQFNKYQFACMVYDEIKKKSTLVINGKRIKTGAFYPYYEDGSWCDLNSFNVKNDSSYIIKYSENDKYYINYNGSVDGGFESIRLPRDNWNFKTSEKNYDYLYKLANRWYAHKNGKNRKIDVIQLETIDNKKYVMLNEKSMGPIQHAEQLQITSSGKYGYVYYMDYRSGWNVNINGNTSRPHEAVRDFYMSEDESWAYAFKENSKWYVNINGVISEPYEMVSDLIFIGGGKWAFKFNENKKWYINHNGKISKAYDVVDHLISSDDGKWGFSFFENQKWYVNINGVASQGYDAIESLNFSNDGKWAYKFKINEKWYSNFNGKISESLSSVGTDVDGNVVWWRDYNYNGEIDISSNNKEHSFYSSYKYEYVVINGRPYGKSPATQAWYDEKKNTFVWTAIEGKELLLYEFKLD